MRICLFGARGKVGSTLAPALEAAGHDVVDGRAHGPAGCDVAVDFTRPDAVLANASACLEARVPVVVGTSGFDADALDRAAREADVPCLYAPNFAIGAVLMMELGQRVAEHMPEVEIVELHHDRKLDKPSGTAARTADLLRDAGANVHEPIHSVRLPGLVAHQELIFGGEGQTLTIRHDSIDRTSFMPGVLLAIKAVGDHPGLTVGLDALLDL
jgi:4-hydroxy-tetrahydrodipicolinate reductase